MPFVNGGVLPGAHHRQSLGFLPGLECNLTLALLVVLAQHSALRAYFLARTPRKFLPTNGIFLVDHREVPRGNGARDVALA